MLRGREDQNSGGFHFRMAGLRALFRLRSRIGVVHQAKNGFVTTFGGSNQPDSSFFDGDLAGFEECAEGLFEGAFADSEFFFDFFGGGVVADGPEAAAGFEFVENLLRKIVDALAAGRVEGEVDLSVRTTVGDVGGEFFAGLEFLKNLIEEEEAGVGVLDDGFVAEVGFGEDDDVDFFAAAPRWRGFVEVAGQARAGDEATAFLIDEDVDEIGFAGFHPGFLFAEGDEEVFRQAPVEEGSGAGDIEAFEPGELAGHGFRLLERGDRPVIGIVVEEDIDEGADGPVGGHFTAGQEDFTEVSRVEIDAESGFAEDGKRGALADVGGHLNVWLRWEAELFLGAD